MCYHTEIGFHLILGHSDTVVRNGDSACIPVDLDRYLEVLLGKTRGLGHGFEVHLIDRIRSVRYDLTEEDLLVSVDRVDHKIQETLGFRFELFLSHPFTSG